MTLSQSIINFYELWSFTTPFVVILFFRIEVFSVYDQLLKGIEHLDPLFVHFGLYNVLQQDQLIESNSEVIAREHDTSLTLNFDGSIRVFLFDLIFVDIEITIFNL